MTLQLVSAQVSPCSPRELSSWFITFQPDVFAPPVVPVESGYQIPGVGFPYIYPPPNARTYPSHGIGSMPPPPIPSVSLGHSRPTHSIPVVDIPGLNVLNQLIVDGAAIATNTASGSRETSAHENGAGFVGYAPMHAQYQSIRDKLQEAVREKGKKHAYVVSVKAVMVYIAPHKTTKTNVDVCSPPFMCSTMLICRSMLECVQSDRLHSRPHRRQSSQAAHVWGPG